MSDQEPSEEFMQYVIPVDDNVVAVCVDCFTEIPDNVADRDPFLMAGASGVCMYCGGPVVVASASAIPSMKARRASGAKLNP